MEYTNKFGLPDTILRAARVNDAKYSKGDVDRSVTQIIQPPRIDMLRKAHFTEMTKDISEEWWALFGSAVHAILEMGATKNTLVEERLYAEIDGWKISGMCDLQEYYADKTVALSDYKVTTAFAIMKEDDEVKAEWEQQLNLLAYLLRCNRPDFKIRSLAIVAIVRDWQRSQAAIDPFYPKAPVVPIKVKLWSQAKQEAFVSERVAIHRAAEMLHEIGEEMPECSDDERWQRESKWAVINEGAKKAAKVFNSEKEAEVFLATRKKSYRIDFRPGKSVRCEGNYCGVAPWCAQFARMREAMAEDVSNETEDEQAA